MLPPVLRLAWEAPPQMQVKVVANGNDTTIVSALPLMTAGWSESILYLLRLHWLALTARSTFLVAAASIFAFVRFGRKSGQSEAKKPSLADGATLENIANGVR